jgi:hypothetical protein
MAKAAKALCARCENRVTAGNPFCGSCGYPTSWANHEERTTWEVAQYRHKTTSVPLGVLYEPKKPTIVLDKPKPSRRIGLFSRKSHAPQLLLPEPKRVDPVEPILKSVPDQPEAVAPAQAPARPASKAAAPAAKPAPRIKPRATDKDRATDDPATVMAMRMLNARVAELDAQVQKLQRQIESMAEEPRSGFGG